MYLRNILLLLIAASVSVTFANSKEADYCNVPSCKPRKHVMCEFSKPGCDTNCKIGHQSYSLTEEQKTDLLDWHNNVRSGVALATSSLVPGGGFGQQVSNMLKLTWSTELERFAQRWADQCKVAVQREHDQCRNTMLSDTNAEVGQLLYAFTYSWEAEPVASILNKMKSEWTQAPLELPKENEKPTGPREWILQVAWPTTSTVGCAMSHFTQGKKHVAQGEEHVAVVVCNYGSSIGERSELNLGSSCTNCPPPRVCSITSPGLCESSDASAPGPAVMLLTLALYVVDTLRRAADCTDFASN